MLDRLLFFLGSTFGHIALSLVARTWKMRVSGWENVLQLSKAGHSVVMFTWHGRLLVSTWHARHHHIVTMISRSRDGELVARVVQKLGYKVARGSSSRGGSEAAREMLEDIRSGRIGAMIGDGPRGPIYKLKPGAAFLAMQANATVIPVIFATNRAWVFKSWDCFTVPKPFARVVLIYGEPILPPKNNDVRMFTRELETGLNALLAKAENLARQNQ